MKPFQIKKETITLIFNFNGKEVILESKRNKYMKDIIEQYLITIEKDHKNSIGFVSNFTPMERADYVVGVPKKGTYKRILTTESGDTKEVKFVAKEGECDGMPYRLEIPLRPFEALAFEFPAVKQNKISKRK